MSGGYINRWVELNKKELIYYREDKDGKRVRSGVISFDHYGVLLEVKIENDMPGFYLHLEDCNEEFYFRTTNTKDLQSWIDAIGLHM